MNKIALLGTLILLVGCTSNRINPSKDDVAQIRDLLQDTYTLQHEQALEKIGWDIDPIILRSAANVFDAFWNPKNLEQYGDLHCGYDLYQNAQYLIVQTRLRIAYRTAPDWEDDLFQFRRYYIDRTVEPKGKEWLIYTNNNFIAEADIPDAKILYLTPQFKTNLYEYLGTEFTKFGTPSIMSTARARDKSAERLTAASKFITVFPNHWGGRWHLISHPEVLMIFLSEDYTKAVVAFRIRHEGGYAKMESHAGDGN